MENNTSDRELACVLFPGLVKNEERAIQCLGGLRQISQVYSKPNIKRLGLNYQPENPYVKRIFATLKREAGVLLKVKVKKKRENNVVKREVVSTSVVGRVKKIFKFDSLCDFQYMPVHRDSPAEPWQCLLDLLPKGMEDVSVMNLPSPLHVPPATFTRADRPFPYSYSEKRYVTGGGGGAAEGGGSDGELHHRRRKERAMPAVKVEFNLTDEFPAEPPKAFVKAAHRFVAAYPPAKEQYALLQKCFEERPIWSQNLIKYSTSIRAHVLKHLLPCVAYHMRSGPWRSLWARYGYDPRAAPAAARYQVLDFRHRHTAGVTTSLRGSNWRRADRVRQARRRRLRPAGAAGAGGAGGAGGSEGEAEEEGEGRAVAESVVRFRPGLLPAQRQTFYMYCDIDIPEVQALVAAAEAEAEAGAGVGGAGGALCHGARGWLRPGADHAARAHILRHVRAALRANPPHAHRTHRTLGRGSSDDESYSEDVELSSASADEPAPAQDTPTTAQDTRTTAQDTRTTAQDTRTTAQDTRTTAQDTPTTAQDTRTTAQDTPTTAQDTPTTAQDTRTTAQDTPTTAQDTPTTAQDTRTTAQDTRTTAQDTRTTAQDTRTTAQDTPTTAQDTPTTAQDTPTTSQAPPSS